MGSPSGANRALLTVRQLRSHVATTRGTVRAVDGVDFSIKAGERLAIVGESGSGKSFTAMSITGLLPKGASIVSGSIEFDGRDLVGMTRKELVSIRGREIATIFQDPMASLDPLMPIGKQVAESLRIHDCVSRRSAIAQVPSLLEEVGLRDPAGIMKRYPFELSGGMLQRVSIAVALACNPRLLLADEPTTALDPTLQVQVLDLLKRVCAERSMAVILITHDMGVVRHFAERVAVMYAGRVVEEGSLDSILEDHRHPYTRGLIRAMPGLRPHEMLPTIPGSLGSPTEQPAGCRFEPRCEVGRGRSECQTIVPATQFVAQHGAACHHPAGWEIP